MKNKLDKGYLLELYETYEEDNMVYALTILKSLGLKDWFKNIVSYDYFEYAIDILVKNIEFVDMYNLDEFNDYHVFYISKYVDNGISYFNQELLDKLSNSQIKDIIKKKPKLEKYLINCTNYEK